MLCPYPVRPCQFYNECVHRSGVVRVVVMRVSSFPSVARSVLGSTATTSGVGALEVSLSYDLDWRPVAHVSGCNMNAFL